MNPKLVLLALLAGSAVMGSAQSCPRTQEGKLSVTGQGSVQAQPDVAKVVFITVQSSKKTAQVAREEAANATAAVIEAIDAVDGVSREDITTLDVSVQPTYVWNDVSGTQSINGYTFSQRLQVKVNNLTNDVLGAVIDAAVLAGGNNLFIETIQAELSPALKQQATTTARVQAVNDAKAAAQVLAEAAALTLGPVKSFSDATISSPIAYPMPTPNADSMAGPGSMATPINVGTTDVQATVAMEFVICN